MLSYRNRNSTGTSPPTCARAPSPTRENPVTPLENTHILCELRRVHGIFPRTLSDRVHFEVPVWRELLTAFGCVGVGRDGSTCSTPMNDGWCQARVGASHRRNMANGGGLNASIASVSRSVMGQPNLTGSATMIMKRRPE